MESSEEKLLSELSAKAKTIHKKYTVDFNLKVLNLINLGYSLHSISNKLNIDRKTLRDWKDKESSLVNVNYKNIKYRCNKTTGNTKVFTDEEEDQFYQWIIIKRGNKFPIRTKSLTCYAEIINKDFSNKAINTQLQRAYRFLHRYDFSIRNIRHIGQTQPVKKELLQKNFIDKIITKRKELNILEDDDF